MTGYNWIRYNADTIALTDKNGNMYATVKAIKGRKNPNTWVANGYSIYSKMHESRTFYDQAGAKAHGEEIAKMILAAGI